MVVLHGRRASQAAAGPPCGDSASRCRLCSGVHIGEVAFTYLQESRGEEERGHGRAAAESCHIVGHLSQPPACDLYRCRQKNSGPSPYEGLPPHMQPLPDSDEGEADVDVSNTVPLGSGSTQEWMGSQLYDRRGAKYRQSFTSLLHEGAQDEERLPPVDLTIGLRSGSPSSATRTVLVNPHPNDDAGQVTLVGRRTRGGSAPQETSEKARERPRVQATSGPSIPRTTGGRPEWMNPPPVFSRGRNTVPRPVERGVSEEDFPFEGAHGDGRRVWKESRQELRRQQEESITQGVQRLRVGERAGQADAVGGGGDVWTDGDEVQCDAEEDDNGDVFPLRAPNMGGRGGRGRASTNAGRRWKRSSATSADAEGEGDEEGGRNFWSVDHMVALIRAKRDLDAQLQAAGHAFAWMRSREWKWLDVRERLLKVGVDRPTDKCGKKWDNLMQQFKKIHTFMGISGKEDFLQLTSQQRAEKRFSFNMDRAVYEEIKGAKERSHTISPSNVADTGAAGGVQLPSAQSATPKSVGDGDAAGDGNDEDDSSARGGSQTTGSPTGFRKRKNVRQQIFEALSECMEKHGALMASTMESASRGQCEAMESASKRQCSIQIRQCEAIEAKVEVQKQHCVASNKVSKLMCHALLEIAKAIRERRVVVVSSSSPSSLSVFSAMTNTRNSGKGKRGRDSQKMEAAGVVKRGRHHAKKPKASSGSALVIGRSAREEWVTKASSGQDDDFESEADTFHGRKGTLRELSNARMVSGEEGVDGGKDGGHEVARGKGEAGGGVGGGVAAREERGQPTTPGMRGAVPSKDVQAAQDVGKHPPMRAPSNPATPTAGQARRDEGAGVNAAVRGQLATRKGSRSGGGCRWQRRSGNLAALEAKAKLWVDDLHFWNETEGHGMFKIIQETCLHLIAIAKGVKPSEIRKSIVLPNATIPRQKLKDVSELGAAKERASRVQTIALRIIHGWIFKSPNRARGYHCSYGYVLNHVATDLARAIWFGEDWRVCVSPAVVHNTLELHMKLPIWYVGGVIHDRHEEDEMASYQESTTQRLVGAFTNAVDMGEGVDGGRISYERLRNVADCMRLLLSAAMWIMRMAGDNLRSHFEASHLVELIAKPTLIASLHGSFDARRHVLQCVNAALWTTTRGDRAQPPAGAANDDDDVDDDDVDDDDDNGDDDDDGDDNDDDDNDVHDDDDDRDAVDRDDDGDDDDGDDEDDDDDDDDDDVHDEDDDDDDDDDDHDDDEGGDGDDDDGGDDDDVVNDDGDRSWHGV
ncbi:hypothetical protein CBR_g34303 [Chara braunii]|uniref:Myb/SANT-like DNA-binding domain-containing protein n=1 Tax=Chara braunii TaxID=69332 RepID=A0A388JYT3_CHABU|nr:hypothetical protein CBR_g34303 [Chara braunii]|eukprot:GBG62932.1 hypothetical protein CBR_g34303 [Chara braunii]